MWGNNNVQSFVNVKRNSNMSWKIKLKNYIRAKRSKLWQLKRQLCYLDFVCNVTKHDKSTGSWLIGRLAKQIIDKTTSCEQIVYFEIFGLFMSIPTSYNLNGTNQTIWI